jgi:light-regulated signal transduction histidine kinase (bacteriophytochrome)
VEKHKGKVEFETRAGKGTTFILRLPLDGIGPKDNSPAAQTACIGA